MVNYFNLEYTSIDHSKWRNLPPPPGFSSLAPTSRAPAKVPTAASSASYASPFMLYMSGGGVQIFSMAFAPFAPTTASVKSLKVLPLQKIAYIACNLLTLAVGLWKCRSMGLLPTGTGDWLAFESRAM
ncbi:hypothetical protein BDR07DRAFT_1437987 [Suillus spraguei]|nr:hypothetical protein BDR07DRAFT_1437987 [Suillus spraguei]